MAELCQHVGSRGKNKDIKCKNKANHGSYCKKHQKKKVEADLARDEVFGEPEAAPPEPEAPAPKYKFSVWHFTLNSQSDFSKMSAEDKRKFKNVCEFVFCSENIHNYLEDRTSPEDAHKNLVDCKIEWHPEVGEQQHRLHVHGVIDLKHNGNFRLCNEKVRGVIEKVLGKRVHFNATGSSNAEAVWKQYMLKNQNAQKIPQIHIPSRCTVKDMAKMREIPYDRDDLLRIRTERVLVSAPVDFTKEEWAKAGSTFERFLSPPEQLEPRQVFLNEFMEHAKELLQEQDATLGSWEGKMPNCQGIKQRTKKQNAIVEVKLTKEREVFESDLWQLAFYMVMYEKEKGYILLAKNNDGVHLYEYSKDDSVIYNTAKLCWDCDTVEPFMQYCQNQ